MPRFIIITIDINEVFMVMYYQYVRTYNISVSVCQVQLES